MVCNSRMEFMFPKKQEPCEGLFQTKRIVSKITFARLHTSGQSISRILSSQLLGLCDHLSGRCVAAPLGAAYPELTFSPREKVRMKTSRLPLSADNFVPAWPCSRRGLPGHPYYYRCRWSFTPPFHHHQPQRGGCLFLWPSSGRLAPHGGFPAPGAIRRRALWSADFPRSRQRRTAIARPT